MQLTPSVFDMLIQLENHPQHHYSPYVYGLRMVTKVHRKEMAVSLAQFVHRLIKTAKEKDTLIKLTLDNISIKRMSTSSGLFIGEKNTLEKFKHTCVINEALGGLSGNKNMIRQNYWVKNREKWEDD